MYKSARTPSINPGKQENVGLFGAGSEAARGVSTTYLPLKISYEEVVLKDPYFWNLS